MPYSVEGKLVVAISSRALFDFEEENNVFDRDGEGAYINLQFARLDVPAREGAARRGGDPVEERPGFRLARVPIRREGGAAARTRRFHERADPLQVPRRAEGEPVPVGERGRRHERARGEVPGGARVS